MSGLASPHQHDERDTTNTTLGPRGVPNQSRTTRRAAQTSGPGGEVVRGAADQFHADLSRSMLMFLAMVSSGLWYGGSSSAGVASPRQEKLAAAMPTSWNDWWSLEPRRVTGEIWGWYRAGRRRRPPRRWPGSAGPGEGEQPVARRRVPARRHHVVLEDAADAVALGLRQARARSGGTRSGPVPRSPTARTGLPPLVRQVRNTRANSRHSAVPEPSSLAPGAPMTVS